MTHMIMHAVKLGGRSWFWTGDAWTDSLPLAKRASKETLTREVWLNNELRTTASVVDHDSWKSILMRPALPPTSTGPESYYGGRGPVGWYTGD